MKKNYIKNEQGVAFVTVLILMIILFFYGFSLWYNSIFDYRHALREEKKIKAYYLARGGVNAIDRWMAENPEKVHHIINKTSKPLKLGDGTVIINVSSQGDNLVKIEATGEVEGVQEKIALIVSLTNDHESYIDMAIFSQGNIVLEGGATITGPVMTNTIDGGGVSLSHGTKIYGDLYIGPGGDVEEVISTAGWWNKPEDYITGEIRELDVIKSHTLPEFPPFPGDLPLPDDVELVVGHGGNKNYMISADAYYSLIEINSNGTLFIDTGQGERHIRVKTLRVNQGHIVIQGTGKLALYVENDFYIGGSSTVNSNGDYSSLLVYYRGDQALNFGGATEFFGTIYALSCDFNFFGSGGFYGFLISGGDKISVSGGSNVNAELLYAPNARLEVNGGALLEGIVIVESIFASGGASIAFADTSLESLPEEFGHLKGGSDGEYIRLWK